MATVQDILQASKYEVSFSESVSMYESLGNPDKFKNMMDSGIIRNGVNDSKTESFIFCNGQDYCFKIRHVGNGAYEWVPKYPMTIKGYIKVKNKI